MDAHRREWVPPVIRRLDRPILLVFAALLAAVGVGAALWLQEVWGPRAGDGRGEAPPADAAARVTFDDRAGERAGAGPGADREAVHPEWRTLRGQVLLAPEGVPVDDAEVRVSVFRPKVEAHELLARIDALGWDRYREDYDADLYGERGGVARTRTDPSGRFTLSDLRETRFHLIVRSPHGYQDTYPLHQLTEGIPVAPVTVWLQPGAELAGQVVDTARSPVPGARLELFSPLLPIGVVLGEIDGFRKWLTHSDPDGRFQFEPLPPDRPYVLMVTAEGFGGETLRGLSLRAGQPVERVILLPPGAGLQGLVVDPEGDPVEAAWIVAAPMTRAMESSLAALRKEHQTRTASDGRFFIADLPAAQYRLYVRKDGYLTQVVRGVLVRPGPATPALRIALRSGLPITGIVLDGASRPVPDARLRAYRPRRPGVIDLSDMGEDLVFPNETKSDSAGRFSLAVGPGRWNVEVAAEGRATQTRAEVDAGSEIAVVLADQGGIDGIVVSAQTGQPVAEYSISVRRGIFGMHVQRVRHAEGRFALRNMDPGRYQVTFEAAGHADLLRDGIEVREGEIREGLVAILQPGRTVAGRVIDARTGEGIAGAMVASDHEHPIDRNAAREDLRRFGLGEEDLSYGVLPGFADPAEWMEGFARFERRRTDAAGRFELPGLPLQPVRLRVTHPRYRRSAPIEIERAPASAGDPAEVVIELRSGGCIEGAVRDSSGQGLAGALILATRGLQALSRQCSTDEQGNYVLAGLDPGAYTLLLLDLDVSQDDDNVFARILSRMQPRFVTLRAEETVRVDFAVAAVESGGTQVRGELSGPRGPVSGGMIVAAPGEALGNFFDQGVRSAQVREDGSFQIEGLRPGKHAFRYNQGRPFGHGIRLGEYVIPEQPIHELALRLPLGQVRGRLVDAEGLPVEGASLRIAETRTAIGEQLLQVGRVTSAIGGEFVFPMVPPGTYQLSLAGLPLTERQEDAQDLAVLELGAEEDRDLGDVVLLPATTVEGVVRDAAGRVVASALVQFEPVDGGRPVPVTFSQHDGFYRRGGVPAGSIRVRAHAEGHGSACSDELSLRAGEVVTVDLVVRRGIDVTVQLIGGDARQRSHARVILHSSDGRVVPAQPRMRDLLQSVLGGEAAARRHFPDLTPGEWSVEVTSEDGGIRAERHLLETDGQILVVSLGDESESP